jgi:hypothetical protein
MLTAVMLPAPFALAADMDLVETVKQGIPLTREPGQ